MTLADENSMRRALALVVLLCVSASSQTVATHADSANVQDVMVVGGVLVDVRNGSSDPNSMVLIHGQRISKIGTAATLEIPKGARIVDAHGKWVLPKLSVQYPPFRQTAPREALRDW